MVHSPESSELWDAEGRRLIVRHVISTAYWSSDRRLLVSSVRLMLFLVRIIVIDKTFLQTHKLRSIGCTSRYLKRLFSISAKLSTSYLGAYGGGNKIELYVKLL